MLITNENLNRRSVDSLLENSVYLDQSVVLNTPMTVPVIQFNEGTNIIPFDYVDRLSEETGWDLESTLDKVRNVNGIDRNNTVVCMEEYYALLHPELLNYLNSIGESVVLKEINDNDCVSKFVDECVDMFLESDNDEYINIDNMIDILNEKFQWSADGGIKPKNKDFSLNMSLKDKEELWDKDKNLEGKRVEYSVWSPGAKEGDKWQVTTLGSTVGKEYAGIPKLLRTLSDKPRDFIAKTAARLREKYRMWLQKANQENNTGKQKWYKKIARKIMQAIDWCMKK